MHIDWTTLIGPAVVAGVIAAAVSIIVAVINRATLRAMHKERLALDRDLADRRANADIALAERKVALDRALEAWKRRTEFLRSCLPIFIKLNASLMKLDRREAWETKDLPGQSSLVRQKMKREH